MNLERTKYLMGFGNMENPLMLKISVAIPPNLEEAIVVYRAIGENVEENAQCYRLDETKVTAAAIEFVVILSSAAAIATIANALYQIWKDHKENGQLYVAVIRREMFTL